MTVLNRLVANWSNYIGILAILMIITACGDKTLTPPASTTALEHAQSHLNPKYVCPMHPQIMRDAPGTCPICGMTLVEKTVQTNTFLEQAEPTTTQTQTVTLSPVIIQTMGVRTAPVKRGTLARQIRTVGSVTYAHDKLVHIHPRAKGWVEKLFLHNEGDRVEAGQILLELYSPEILATQMDVLRSSQTMEMGHHRMMEKMDQNDSLAKENARRQLRAYNIPDSVINQIETSGKPQNTVPVATSQAGVVVELNVREGMYVTPNSQLMTIADLSTVWVIIELFEAQLNWIEPHLKADVKISAYPELIWIGELDTLYPELDPQTRTLKAKIVLANPDQRLKPNLFAQVTLYGTPKANVLKIDRAALIATGERTYVLGALGAGQFKPMEVVTGLQVGEEVEILNGLEENQTVVISGQFLIDSEANLQASFKRLGADN